MKWISFLFLFFLAGCGNSNGMLAGTWLSSCTRSVDGTTTQQSNFFFDGNSSFRNVVTNFNDGVCADQAYTVTSTGTYTANGTQLTTVVGGVAGSTVATTAPTAIVLPLTSTGAGLLENQTYGGLTGWQTGTSQTVNFSLIAATTPLSFPSMTAAFTMTTTTFTYNQVIYTKQ